MVGEKEGSRKPNFERQLCATIVRMKSKVQADDYYEIRDNQGRRPMLEVGPVNNAGIFLITQQNPKSNDVIELTVGQLYDLLWVGAKLLDVPVKGDQ